MPHHPLPASQATACGVGGGWNDDDGRREGGERGEMSRGTTMRVGESTMMGETTEMAGVGTTMRRL